MIIKGNLIDCAADCSLRIIKNGYLVLENGIIKGVYENDRLPDTYKNDEITDYKDALIIPGLTDLHIHAPQFTFRGLGMDLELLDWLNTYTFVEESKYNNINYAKKAYEIFVNKLKQSFTTRACIFATIHNDATLALMDLLEESGLITMVGKVNMDRNSPDYLIEKTVASVTNTKNWLNKAIKKYKRTMPIITPRFIPSCTDELMLKLGDIIKDGDYHVQSHLSENPSEVAWVKELCPESSCYLDAYQKRNVLSAKNNRAIMAHCVYSDDKEIEILKENKIYVAHCPQSNVNLSSGIAPVRKFMQNGISIGLGSDIAAGYSLSILRIAAEAVGASKLYFRYIDNKAKPLSSAEAFYLATRGGGSYFGKVGAFEESYDADLVVINDDSLRTLNDDDLKKRIERVVYLSEECCIIAKYVKGTRII